MSASLSITETQVFTALRTVLGTFGLVSSTGVAVPIVRGQINRVPEVAGADFVVMWPLMRNRLSLNVDVTSDNIVTGSIASNVLTVTAVQHGVVVPGAPVYQLGNTTQLCTVIAQLSGTPEGIGTYSVTPTANLTSGTLYCGTLAALAPMEQMVQIDVHGPASADNAQRIATLMRDQFGVSAFIDAGYDVAPLYTNNPRQIPFVNGENQIEERWIVETALQINPIVTVTQQFADALVASTTEVEAAYPVA